MNKRKLNNSADSEPSADLLERVLNAVSLEKEKRDLRRRFFLFGGFFTLTAAVLPYSLGLLAKDLSSSGFTQLFGLLFTDFSAVAASYQDFLISLAESMPAFSFGISLVSLGAFILSLRFLTSSLIKNQFIKSPVKLT